VQGKCEDDYSAPIACLLRAFRVPESMMTRRSSRVVALAGSWLLVLVGCTAPPRSQVDDDSVARAPSPAPAAAPAAPPALSPAAFPEVVARAGEQLLRDAQGVVGSGPRELIIDPLIDASTGQQTAGTVAMGQQLGTLIKTRMPQWSQRPLTRTSLSSQPLLSAYERTLSRRSPACETTS
jgi:pyruvate/2-oxoglutarate dehydrogenase complex dihydrolipoamide acyltransferase (E2) component